MFLNGLASICAASCPTVLWGQESAIHNDKASHLGKTLNGSSLPEHITGGTTDREGVLVEMNQRLRVTLFS